MNRDLDDKCSEEDFIIDIAYNNIILKGFLYKALEEEKNKVPLNVIVNNCTKIFEDIFKTNFNKIDVIKKTMKDDSEKIDKTKVLEYLDNDLFPKMKGMLDLLNSKVLLNVKLSPQISNIIFSTYKIFIKIIKKEMKEYEKTQKIIAESLLEKEVLENIRNKLKHKKKNKTKNDNKEEEITITTKISEARKLKLEHLLSSEDKNKEDCLKKYITELEKDLEEKEAFVQELLLEEYIQGENYQTYQQKIEDQFTQIDKYNQKIHELERDKKKFNSEKNNLNKTIFHLNQEIDRLKNKLLCIQKKNTEIIEKNNQLSDENKELNEKLALLTEENNKSNEKIALLTEENNKSNENIYAKNSEIERLKNDIYLLNIKIEKRDAKINNMEKANEYMKLEHQKLIAEFEDLKKLYN